MLYIATAHAIPLRTSPALCVDEVDPRRRAIVQWFSLPSVQYVGAHNGCSCGFPSCVAEQRIEYYEGFFDDAGDDREKDLTSVRSLFDLIDESLKRSPRVELLPVWNGHEHEPPQGLIEAQFSNLRPETFFFQERFLYRLT